MSFVVDRDVSGNMAYKTINKWCVAAHTYIHANSLQAAQCRGLSMLKLYLSVSLFVRVSACVCARLVCVCVCACVCLCVSARWCLHSPFSVTLKLGVHSFTYTASSASTLSMTANGGAEQGSWAIRRWSAGGLNKSECNHHRNLKGSETAGGQ